MVSAKDSAIDSNETRNFDVSRKLEKEKNALSNLRDILSKSSNVSTNVSAILDTFERRLATLETTILPVYQQTGNLQRRQQNTEKTLLALDYVIEFYNVAGQVESVIQERPGAIGVAEYLDAMNKLMAAYDFFRENNPQAIELENVKSLLDKGTQQLVIEFREELKKYQKPVPPNITLQLIKLQESELTEEVLSGVDLIPESARGDLRSIATWLNANGKSDRLTVYGKERAYVLSESLKALRVHDRSGSGGERGGDRTPLSPMAFTPPTGLNSPAVSRAKFSMIDTSRMNASKLARRVIGTVMSSTTASPSSWKQGSPAAAAEDALDDTDVSVYLNQVSALHRLGCAELQVTRAVVPSDRMTHTFEIIFKDALSHIALEGEALSQQAHRSVCRGELQAVLSLLDLLRHMSLMQRQYHSLLIQCQASFNAKFSGIVNTLQESTAKALDVFVESVRSDERGLPKDGTVHELTSNALVFVEQLILYKTTLEPILAGEQINEKERRPPLYADTLLGNYIKRVLANLGLALVHHSSSYSDSTLSAIFKLNNYNYILKTLLENQALLQVVILAEPSCIQTYNQHILQQKKTYMENLRRLLQYIDGSDDLALSVLQTDRLRDRDRQTIKEKFSGFNKELDEMQKTQRGYSVPDHELRESIKRDNKEVILPKYQAFYDKYSCVPFSKAPEKYIKFTPANVSHKLEEFFDVAA